VCIYAGPSQNFEGLPANSQMPELVRSPYYDQRNLLHHDARCFLGESYFNPAHLDTTLISIIFVLYLQAVYPLKQYDILVLSPANISDLVSDLSYLEIWNRNLLP
jgi:hypothetical protein